MGKGILKEIKEFLEYLARADENARKEENLKKKFGEERYKAIYNLIGGKYTGGLPKKEEKKRYLILYINDNGLKFLEENNKIEKIDNHNKIIIYLTVMLVLTNIAFFFKDTISPTILGLLYGIFSILILIYFKKSKTIKL